MRILPTGPRLHPFLVSQGWAHTEVGNGDFTHYCTFKVSVFISMNFKQLVKMSSCGASTGIISLQGPGKPRSNQDALPYMLQGKSEISNPGKSWKFVLNHKPICVEYKVVLVCYS